MKKILPLFIAAMALILIPAIGTTGTFWNFGLGITSFSGGGNCGFHSVAIPVVPVVPAMPYGSTTIFFGSTSCWMSPHPYDSHYHHYYPRHPYPYSHVYPCRPGYPSSYVWSHGQTAGTYLYGGAYHPAPRCYVHRHAHPYLYGRTRIHINRCNRCNFYGNSCGFFH